MDSFLFESSNLEKDGRLRFVKDHEGKLWFDVNEKAPADKAIYLPCQRDYLVKAIAEESFDKEIMPQVTAALKKKLLESLGLAKKSGLTVLGLEKVKEVHHKGTMVAVFLGSDAGNDVTKRVHSWGVGVCTELTKDELSQALGGENISLVGLLDKPQVENVKIAWERYQTFFIENK